MVYAISQSKWLKLAIILFVVLLVFGAYFKIRNAEFVYDDYSFIVNNELVHSFSPFSKFLLSPDIFTGTFEPGGKNWRPIASFAFAAEYYLFGLDPTGYHWVSILLHLLNVILVFLLVCKLTGRQLFSGLITLVWGLHPVATEAVSWIANQSSLIFLSFFLLAALSVLKFRENQGQKSWLFASFFFFILSLITKETALGGVFVLPLIFFFGGKTKGESLGWKKFSFQVIAPSLFLGLVYFWSRYQILGALEARALHGSFFQNLLLAPAVLVKYLGLSFWPVNLLLEYSNFPLPLSLVDYRVILGLLLFLAGAILFFVCLKKSWFHSGLGLVWFFGFLAPVLQIIPFHDIVGERFLYAPLIGFIIFLFYSFESVFEWFKSRFRFSFLVLGKVLIFVVIAWFFILTLNRNNDWLDSVSLWTSVLRVDARNERAFQNLSVAYFQRGEADKVVEYASQLLELYPQSQVGHLHLALGKAMQGNLKEAIGGLEEILKKDPNYAPVLLNLSAMYVQTGRLNDALELLKKLAVLEPWNNNIKARIADVEVNLAKKSQPSPGSDSESISFSEIGIYPRVEGNVITSGVFGEAQALGQPFPAIIEVYEGSSKTPLITVRANETDGNFQIPLKPGFYHLKPLESELAKGFKAKSYDFNLVDYKWIKLLINYQ